MFLKEAFKQYYDLKAQESEALVSKIKFYHPYGTVGELPSHSESNPVRFGEKPENVDLIDVSNRIRTFTEGVDPKDSNILEIRNRLLEAEKIVFLGFGFDDLNMSLLFPGANKENDSILVDPAYGESSGFSPQFLGTVHKMSADNVKVISENLKKMSVGISMPKLDDCRCCEFFDNYWKALGG